MQSYLLGLRFARNHNTNAHRQLLAGNGFNILTGIFNNLVALRGKSKNLPCASGIVNWLEISIHRSARRLAVYQATILCTMLIDREVSYWLLHSCAGRKCRRWWRFPRLHFPVFSLRRIRHQVSCPAESVGYRQSAALEHGQLDCRR